MNPIAAIAASIVLSTALAITIALLLRQPLLNLLVDLCGSESRARFWAITCVLFTVLSTLYGVLFSLPISDPRFREAYEGLALALSGLRAGVLGLLLALGWISFILLRWIVQTEKHRHEHPAA